MNFLRYLSIAVLIFLVVLSGGFSYFVYTVIDYDDVPEPRVPLTTRIYDGNDQLMALRYRENRLEISLDEMPQEAVAATVALEDQRFYQHLGFDLAGMGRAMLSNLKTGQFIQGGSTITQQLAKNLFLSHERTISRKIKEAAYTIHLERKYSKDEILEKYLNTIYYGHGAYGLEAAAQTYFSRSARELTLGEIAMLVGLPRGPVLYSPYYNREAALARQKTVLNVMVEAGIITKEQKQQALAEELSFAALDREESWSYFLDYIINVELTELFDGNLEDIYAGGLEIYTTVDPHIQQTAEEIMAGLPLLRMDEQNIRQPQGALVAIDPQTGYVKALVGGRDYTETKYNRVFSLRSPGSAFKPFLYAAALEQGYTAASTQLCEPVSYEEEGMDPYRPTDYGGVYHHDHLTFREALAKSCNITAIKTHVELGRDRMVEMASRLGITSPLDNILSLPLGTEEVTLMELTTAFAPFANGGYRLTPILLRKVVDAEGNVLLENKPRREKVLDERIAYLITDMLKGVVREGGTASGVAAILHRPAAGKSGTSHDSKNTHMIGYTPDLVAGLYIGDDLEEPLGSTGGQLAAPLWAEFMEKALQGKPARDFEMPAGITRIKICQETGLRQSPYCSGPFVEEIFIEGTEPTEQCSFPDCPHCRPNFWWPWRPYFRNWR